MDNNISEALEKMENCVRLYVQQTVRESASRLNKLNFSLEK